MRLIDADGVIAEINKNKLLTREPAYDTDKVIEQLKAEGCISDNAAGNRAVEIIKAGGMDE